MALSNKLDALIPFLEISHHCIISKSGDCTVGYEIIKQPLFSLSHPEYEIFCQAWPKACRILPHPAVVHLQDWYTQERYEADPAMVDDSFLARSGERYFNERPYLEHRAYCFLTWRCGSRRPATSASSGLLRPSLVPEYILRPAQLREFLDRCDQFRQMLEDSGLMKVRRLSDDELTGGPQHAGIIEQYCQLTPPEGQPVLRDIHFDEGISIGDRHGFFYTLADAEQLPAQCSPYTRHEPYSTDRTPFPIGFATPLGPLLDANHIYNQYIFLDDPQPVLRKLETRRRRYQSLSTHARDNAITAETIGRYLQEAAAPQRLPVKAHFNVFAWVHHPAEIKDCKNKVSSVINSTGAVPRLETVGAPQIWWAGIPGNAADLPINETFDTFAEQAACFLVPETNDRSSPSPFGIRLGDRLSGRPLHVDISDEPKRKGEISNLNKLVVGGSGSGKSFFINHMIRSFFEQLAHILLVDVGGSYEGLCDLLGGYYFTYNEDDPLCFNPFWLAEGDRPDTEKKESIKTLLVALWKKGEDDYLRSEYVALSNALQGYYQYLATHKDIFPCFNSFYEYVRTEFANELAGDRVREKYFDLDNFLYVLRPFYKGGEYDFLLNARKQLDLLHQRFIIFELDNIKDHPVLFPVVTIIIMETFISKMRKLSGVRKVLIIEEAWKAIAKEGMAEYIKYAFKTVRKFFGEAIVVTQEVDDLISSPIVRQAIINNADCKILLDQSKFQNKFEPLQELLGLTDKDKALVLSLNKANDPTRRYKEVFIGFANGPSKVYRVEVSLEEYLTYTTDEAEKVKVLMYRQRFGNMRKAVSCLAADLRSGVVQLLVAAAFLLLFLLIPSARASAQILEIIDEAVKKVLVAADLQVQRLQTQTIWLQEAQKTLENTMEQLDLDDITGWVQRQKDLYSNYYQELWQVKSAFSAYSKVKNMVTRQAQLVAEAQKAWLSIRQDAHFSPAELDYIKNAYTALIDQTARNMADLGLVIQSFLTQMDDAGRLQIIDETADSIDLNYADLRQFTQQNILISLQRSRDGQDLQTIRMLYGIH